MFIWNTEPYALHYAEVVEIRILKCPTLTNYFSVVFRPGCPKFCVDLRKLPKNLEKAKKEKSEEEKKGKMQKHEGGVCEGQDWSHSLKWKKSFKLSSVYTCQHAKLLK